MLKRGGELFSREMSGKGLYLTGYYLLGRRSFSCRDESGKLMVRRGLHVVTVRPEAEVSCVETAVWGNPAEALF